MRKHDAKHILTIDEEDFSKVKNTLRIGGLVDTYIARDAEIISKTLRVNMWKCSMCLS
jgi:hypothetical protein